jgi:type 2 lantibiotic biosynthesis protein LanM
MPAAAPEQSFLDQPAWYSAVTLSERAAHSRGHLNRRGAQTDHAEAAHRIGLWRSQAPFQSGACFAQRLALDGLAEQDLFHLAGQSGDAIRDQVGSPPEWLRQLAEAFTAQAPRAAPSLRVNDPLGGLLALVEPLAASGRARLLAALKIAADACPDPPFDADSVLAVLSNDLDRRLLQQLMRVMLLELNVARLEERLHGATAEERFQSFLAYIRRPEAALSILQEYPVLTRQMTTYIAHWADFGAEFIARLCADWEEIRNTFCGADPGPLADLSPAAGDSHRRGRSVRIATFRSGFRLVYKPRPLSLDSHFQSLLQWLNRRGAQPSFRPLKILDRGSYGWSEFAPHESCVSEAEVRAYYERLGGFLALLYALEATDVHAENVIAMGPHPMLVDLEALFQPRFQSAEARLATGIAAGALSESVLRAGLLPQGDLSRGGKERPDFSGIGSAAGQLSPAGMPVVEGAGTDEMRLVRKRLPVRGVQNQPALHGEKIRVPEYAGSLAAGFDRTYRLLLACRGELLAETGPLAAFKDDEVRVIARSTQIYSLILRESLHPDLLRNALDRDRLFDRLWAGIEARPYLARLIAAEQRDLHNGDVPVFTTRASSLDVWTSERQRIPEFLGESGMALARRRLQHLSEADCSRQLWLIRASMATLAPGRGKDSGPRYTLDRHAPAIERSAALPFACSIGDRLEALALRSEHDVSWVGLVLNEREQWCISPLGADLYDGLPGVILFLAYLGRLTGVRRYKKLAEAALAALWTQFESQPPGGMSIGAFDGLGGIVYLLAHLSVLWEDGALMGRAESLIAQLPALVAQDRRFDVTSGSAGCLAVLLGLYGKTAFEPALAAARQCGDRLIAGAQPVGEALAWMNPDFGPRPLLGFSHGAAGIAWALFLLSSQTGERRYRDAALRAVEYERSLFSEEAGNWPDLRAFPGESEQNRFQSTWCHGAAGIGLSRLRSLAHCADPRFLREIAIAARSTLTYGFGENHCLCHGDLGNLEFVLAAKDLPGVAERADEPDRMAAAVVNSIAKHGPFCANSQRVETPGLMTGLAGIGYGLLRLACPESVPAVLTLDAPLL